MDQLQFFNPCMKWSKMKSIGDNTLPPPDFPTLICHRVTGDEVRFHTGFSYIHYHIDSVLFYWPFN